MAEPKRIQLEPPKTLQKSKKLKDIPPTYRFELQLDEKDSDFAEYSYAELVKGARNQERESKQQPGSDDPFSLDEDVEKLQEIARRLEEKYNPKPGRKKKKKVGISEDFVDKGLGYDETDPFIDNEEAYDELVPSTLTTEFGGFYINKGDLEFRNLSDPDSCNYELKMKRKRLKQGIDKEKKKRRIGLEDGQKRRGRRPLNDALSALKPKKKTQPTVADMLQQHKANLQRMQHEGLQQIQLDPIKVDRELEPEEIEEEFEAVPSEEMLVNPSTICDAIESVVKAGTVVEDAGSNGSVGPITGSSDGEEVKPPVENIESIEAPKLPDNLPPELDDVVAKLKVAAYKSEEGKCKFFSDEVNRMLLSVELKAQELTSAQRSIIYAHLASHLPCTKETLQKRAKKLRLDQEDGKLREPMQRLREGIASVMPDLMEKYAALVQECDAREEEKKNGTITGTDGEDSQEENEKKICRLPKKRFEWNDTIRKYLCDVVRIKLKCYEVSKTRIQSAEEYLRHFLEAEVKNLWPSGWMQSRVLFRESRAAHFYITNRPKKQILVPRKTMNPLSVMMNLKSGMSILNNTIIPQDTEFDQIFHDKSVPLIPPVENVRDKTENIELLTPSHGISTEDRAAEFNKLFTLPINTSTDEVPSVKNSDTFNQIPPSTNKVTTDLTLAKTSSPLINLISESMVPSKTVISKSDKHCKSNKQLPYTPKVSDLNTFAEGSLASDMLARIICASLADFPYAGSHNAETSSKTASVISPNPAVMKESHSLIPKFPNDSLTSPKKIDGKQFNADARKSSQDSGLNSFASLGINIESFFNSKSLSVSRTNDTIVKNKGLPTESSIVNLKLKDSIVPHPRQFAEAFERTSDTPPVSKKHSNKGNSHAQSSSVSCVNASSRFINDHTSDYPSSTSPRTLENAQKLAFDLAKYNTSISSQGSVAAPYKKRSKYSQNSKVSEQWNQHFLEATLGTSLLEGMKGFPFPVASLPTPPPAHSSSPHRTSAHSQHTSPRTISHISPGLRTLHESKSDSSNHNSQTHSNIISATDIQRRQSLIQGPWKSSPQSPSTSLSHYMASTSPPISNQCKTTSSNHHTSSSVNMSPVPAHSMSQIEKVSAVYNRSHSPLPLRASPSHMPLSHPTKTSPSNAYSSHIGQTPYTTHQSSHTVSSTHHPAIVRTTAFDPSNTITSSSTTGTFTASPEMKAVNPRTN